MNKTLLEIQRILPSVIDKAKAKIDRDQTLALLQGFTGFVGGIASKDPVQALESALDIAQIEVNTPYLESLGSTLDSVKEWMTFGKEYTPLEDSSDLDFDKVDVASVPEIMQVPPFVENKYVEN